MLTIQKYVVSVVCAAIICGIISGLIGKKGTYPAIVKLLCGLFVVITAVTPLKNISFFEPSDYFACIQNEAGNITSQAVAETSEEFFKRIKEQTQSYILDKATQLGISIEVEVEFSTEGKILPERVIISGDASPYKKNSLKRIITAQLNISEDALIWK